MKKKFLTVGMLTILATAVGFFVTNKQDSRLVNPNLVKPTLAPTTTPAPPVAPTTFQFDGSTDLEAELEKVNPEVLDSDFE